MIVTLKMRFSSLRPYKDKETGENRYLLKMLDENDDVYYFPLTEEKAKPFMGFKHYQEYNANLNFFKDNASGLYKVFLNI